MVWFYHDVLRLLRYSLCSCHDVITPLCSLISSLCGLIITDVMYLASRVSFDLPRSVGKRKNMKPCSTGIVLGWVTKSIRGYQTGYFIVQL